MYGFGFYKKEESLKEAEVISTLSKCLDASTSVSLHAHAEVKAVTDAISKDSQREEKVNVYVITRMLYSNIYFYIHIRVGFELEQTSATIRSP